MPRSSTLTKIRTSNKNITLQNKLLSARPPLQQPGQLYAHVQQHGGSIKGGALRDKYGSYLYIPHS